MGDKGKGRDGRRDDGAADGAAETVARVLGTVRYAADGRAAEDAVETGASALSADPAGPEAVSRALLTAAAAAVRGCWEGGWHPADLVRLVRRAGAPIEPAADLVAAELRRYPADALPPRWAAQLREAGAEVWWPDDGGYLDALARRRRTTRFEALCDVLEVLRVLGRLPRVTPTGPLPGEPGARTAAPRAGAAAGTPGGEPRVLGRIRGLLAKAESTAFPEEAEALSAKAQELMARYRVSEALLAGAAAADGPAALRIGIDGPYESTKALLLDAVADANRCRAVWSPEAAFTTLVGFPPDLDAAELLYTSLLVQATTAMQRAADQHHTRGKSRRTKDFRQSFLAGYASRIRDRLTDAAGRVTAEAAEETPDLLPVLAARDLAVEERTGALFPETTAVRMRGIRDADGLHQGMAAADRARLDHRKS
ncbi:DUF2786 domain-containing protein [Streptomyces sp. Ru73]|uniref:DUF2786 domain-containing protein n=1 Tax=Streptomyces sp. Ru73 TaxID=2080748 RepID=UPI0026CDD814|nr:DUF2786 domain-containing protein [Streptomyces sp. Ru73]